MEWAIYLIFILVTGFASYYLTGFIFKKYLGEVFNAVGKNGRRYRVLKRPRESISSALGRLKVKMQTDQGTQMKWGILCRWQSWWVGAHWSPYNKRLCVNLIPLVTVWFTAKGGATPNKGFDVYRNDRVEQELFNKDLEKLNRHIERCDYALTPTTTSGMCLDQFHQIRDLVKNAADQDLPIEEFKQQADQLIGSFKNVDEKA